MSSSTVSCPACGSTKITRHEQTSTDHVTLGSEFTFQSIYYLCSACNEEIDIFDETNQNYQTAQKEANKKFVQHSIESINDNGISMALFERVFELPTRTLARWKDGNFSSSALSLLHIIITYPWIIKVAENRFSPELANRELICAAATKFFESATSSIYDKRLEIEFKSEGTLFAKISYADRIDKKALPRISVNDFERAGK